jgi:hypothetical protein
MASAGVITGHWAAGDVVSWRELGIDGMLMMRCDSVRYLAVGAANGADGSGCWLESREKLQVVRRTGVDQIPEGPSARLTGGLRAVARAPARSSPDARSDPYWSRSSHGGGSCRRVDAPYRGGADRCQSRRRHSDNFLTTSRQRAAPDRGAGAAYWASPTGGVGAARVGGSTPRGRLVGRVGVAR